VERISTSRITGDTATAVSPSRASVAIVAEAAEQQRREEERAENHAREHCGLRSAAGDDGGEEREIAQEKRGRAERAIDGEHLRERDAAERDREHGEGKLRGEQQQRAAEAARGFAEQDGERIEVRHPQQAEGHLLLFLRDGRREIAEPREPDRDGLERDDAGEKLEPRRALPSAPERGEREQQEHERREPGPRDVRELPARILAKRAGEEGEQRGRHSCPDPKETAQALPQRAQRELRGTRRVSNSLRPSAFSAPLR
jgi:hypothetical protein